MLMTRECRSWPQCSYCAELIGAVIIAALAEDEETLICEQWLNMPNACRTPSGLIVICIALSCGNWEINRSVSGGYRVTVVSAARGMSKAGLAYYVMMK